MMDDYGDPLPSIINLDEYLQSKYPRNYEKSRTEWHRSEAIKFSVCCLNDLTVPLVLLLKILSGGIIQATASLIKILVNKTPSI